MNKYILASFIGLFIFLGTFDVINAAGGGTVPETKIRMDGIVPVCYQGDVDVPCEKFEDLVNAVKGVINFAIKFVLAFSVVIIAIAGWKYMTSGGNSGQRTEANKMFVSVGKGIFFILAAWLIVNLIMKALVSDSILQIIKN